MIRWAPKTKLSSNTFSGIFELISRATSDFTMPYFIDIFVAILVLILGTVIVVSDKKLLYLQEK